MNPYELFLIYNEIVDAAQSDEELGVPSDPMSAYWASGYEENTQ